MKGHTERFQGTKFILYEWLVLSVFEGIKHSACDSDYTYLKIKIW